MGLFFYNIFLLLYALGVRVAALWNAKAKLWVNGRKDIFSKVKAWRSRYGKDKIVWMHCASLGEFEQGRPLLEKIKNSYPAYKVLVTFFSPSGFVIRKHYTGADGVFYLPSDGKDNAKKFIDTVDPSLVLWIKYEYWYYYLTRLRQKKIPVVLVSAIFRDDQPFFKFYGGLWRKMLSCFTKIFVQNKNSLLLLEKAGLAQKAVVTGDTRFDRVAAIAARHEPLPKALTDFCKGHRVLVAGSTWEEDEEELVHYVKTQTQIKCIVAPHEIDTERLADAKKLFGNAILYSEFIAGNIDAHVLIIDNIGMLSRLYLLADIAYIGGGFNDSGIHNILEAAVYGKPVIFGPQYGKFSEANDLVDRGGAFSISTALQLEALLDKLWGDESFLKETGNISKNYIAENQGASEQIMKFLYENRLLIN